MDDPLEVEAERVADRVMRMPSSELVVRRCPGGCPDEEVLRRQPVDEEEDELLRTPADGGAPGVVPGEAVRSGGGGGLPPGSLRFFEPRVSGWICRGCGSITTVERPGWRRRSTLGLSPWDGMCSSGRGSGLRHHPR